MGVDIGLLVFDEAHHAIGKHPYNMIMKNHYYPLPLRTIGSNSSSRVRPMVLGLTASPSYGSDVEKAFKLVLLFCPFAKLCPGLDFNRYPAFADICEIACIPVESTLSAGLFTI